MSTTDRPERRVLPRRALAVPIRYRVLGNDSQEMQVGETLNWSERGIFFITKYQLDVGTPLQMFLKMPYQPGSAALSEVRCSARVVHVKPNVGREGQRGVGAFIDRFESSAAEAHAYA